MPAPYVRVTLDMEPDLHEKVRKEAASFSLSVSEMMRARLRAPLSPQLRDTLRQKPRRSTHATKGAA
jgi:hypothetical protein